MPSLFLCSLRALDLLVTTKRGFKGTMPIDVQVLKTEIQALLDGRTAEKFAHMNYFGFRDWAIGTIHDTSNKKPDGTMAESYSTGVTEFLLYKLEGDVLLPPDFQRGAFDGSSPENRPRLVDLTSPIFRMR